MADPRMFDTAVAVAQDEALAAINHLLADNPEAQQPFAERYGNPNLPGSAATLVEAAANDHQVRAAHGQTIMGQAFAHALTAQQKLLTAQQKRIEELEAPVKPAKPTKAAKGGGSRR
jgi:hypothetical protein